MRDEAPAERHDRPSSKWKAWDEFLESKTNAGFMQSSWYASLIAERGSGYFAMVLKDGETVVGGAIIFTHTFAPEKYYYYIPEGPVLLDTESDAERGQVFSKIMEFIDQKRRNEQHIVSHLCINPRWERMPAFVSGFHESEEWYGLPRNTQYINLIPPESDILAQMKQKGRYNIGIARRYGVSVVEDVSPQGIDDFIRIYNEMYARKELGDEYYEPDYIRDLVPVISDVSRGSVFFAEYQGIRLATAVVIYFGNTATYLYGASRSIHRNVMAPYLLHFEIMRKAKALGYQFYDLFGVSPQDGPPSGWSDISVFKRKFGGQELRLVPTLEYVYDPVAYQEWSTLEKEPRRSGEQAL